MGNYAFGTGNDWSQNHSVGKCRAAGLMVIMALVRAAVHSSFGWKAAVEEAAMHGESATMGEDAVAWTRDIFENLPSQLWKLAVPFARLERIEAFPTGPRPSMDHQWRPAGRAFQTR